MEPKWAELKKMSDEELIARHDRIAKRTTIGTGYYVDELRYREQSRVSAQVEKYTRHIFWLTLVVTLATIINVAILFR